MLLKLWKIACTPAGFAGICVAMACTDPIGPEPTEIVVTVDWTVAREPGFMDARWQLMSYDPDGVIRRGPVIDNGSVGIDGLFTVRYSAHCGDDDASSSGHRIELLGHFEAHEGGPLPECSAWLLPRCTGVKQSVTIDGGLPPEACVCEWFAVGRSTSSRDRAERAAVMRQEGQGPEREKDPASPDGLA